MGEYLIDLIPEGVKKIIFPIIFILFMIIEIKNLSYKEKFCEILDNDLLIIYCKKYYIAVICLILLLILIRLVIIIKKSIVKKGKVGKDIMPEGKDPRKSNADILFSDIVIEKMLSLLEDFSEEISINNTYFVLSIKHICIKKNNLLFVTYNVKNKELNQEFSPKTQLLYIPENNETLSIIIENIYQEHQNVAEVLILTNNDEIVNNIKDIAITSSLGYNILKTVIQYKHQLQNPKMMEKSESLVLDIIKDFTQKVTCEKKSYIQSKIMASAKKIYRKNLGVFNKIFKSGYSEMRKIISNNKNIDINKGYLLDLLKQ